MSQPQFEASEVFQAIEMEKNSTFVIVEGVEVDVFDNALRGMLNMKGAPEVGWVVASGSDKSTILDFLRRTKSRNVYAILDRDFTGEVEHHPQVSYLGRYSLENYLFDEMVIRQTSARFYRKSVGSIKIDSDILTRCYQKELSGLLEVLDLYQTANHSRAVAWSERSVLIKDCWQPDVSKINALITAVLEDLPILKRQEKPLSSDVVLNFPAKMIVRGVYHFMRKTVKPPGFTKVFNNERAFTHALFGNLEYSADFVGCLGGAKDFLAERLSLT
jgi:hypothetical protein